MAPGANSKNNRMPTIIGNCHMLFTARAQPERWLVSSEALATQGFPIVPLLCGLQTLPKLSCFNVPRENRTSRSMLVQAGNSMNVLVMSVILLHGLTQWEKKQTPSLMLTVRAARAGVPLGEISQALHRESMSP